MIETDFYRGVTIAPMALNVLYKDITTVADDAVVNSTNPELVGYSGVDAQLHALGGEAFERECREKAGILVPGEALFTNAYNIPARYVIHTFIPAFRGGKYGEAAILSSCYRRCLETADGLGCRSVAFPLIASGIALTDSNKYDIIVKYFLKHGKYDIWEFNEQILKYGYTKLIGAEKGDDPLKTASAKTSTPG